MKFDPNCITIKAHREAFEARRRECGSLCYCDSLPGTPCDFCSGHRDWRRYVDQDLERFEREREQRASGGGA